MARLNESRVAAKGRVRVPVSTEPISCALVEDRKDLIHPLPQL